MSCVFNNKNQVCNVGISFDVCSIARLYQGGRVDATPMFSGISRLPFFFILT
jgi:hypothetical protein